MQFCKNSGAETVSLALSCLVPMLQVFSMLFFVCIKIFDCYNFTFVFSFFDMEESDSVSDARRRKREQRVLKNSSARLAQITYNWSSDDAACNSSDVTSVVSSSTEPKSVGSSRDNILVKSSVNCHTPFTESPETCFSKTAVPNDLVDDLEETILNNVLNSEQSMSDNLLDDLSCFRSSRQNFEPNDLNDLFFSVVHLVAGVVVAIISLQLPLFNFALVSFLITGWLILLSNCSVAMNRVKNLCFHHVDHSQPLV